MPFKRQSLVNNPKKKKKKEKIIPNCHYFTLIFSGFDKILI